MFVSESHTGAREKRICPTERETNAAHLFGGKRAAKAAVVSTVVGWISLFLLGRRRCPVVKKFATILAMDTAKR
jgi:hypothetical protein